MSWYRTLIFQQITVALLLFAALFSQIQVLYACDLRDGKPSHVCCCGKHTANDCPMQDSCAMHQNTLENKCCDLSYDLSTDNVMSNLPSTADTLTLLLDAPQPPPVIAPHPIANGCLRQLARLSPTATTPSPPDKGKQTYLVTRRLRL